MTTSELQALPPELWKKIFDYLNPADLRASTLTCSSFRWLAQPLLFSVFDLSPFFLAPNTDHSRMFRPRKYLDRTLERLQFYRAPHIAPAVYHCWISPYSRWGFPPRHPRDYLDPELIIDKVIEALPFFPNLRILSWHCIDFSATWWDVIRRLPLRKFWINSCTVLASEPMRPPIVTHLDLDHWAWEGETTNHPSVHEGHLSGVSQDMMSLVLHPDCTQHISVPRVDTATRLLALMTTFNDPFTYLQTLRIPLQVISSAYFIQVLINAPLLKELRIFPPEEDLFQTSESPPLLLPSTSLQFLTTYEGPCTLLTTFNQHRQLTDVSVWGLDKPPNFCLSSHLVHALHQFSYSNTLLALHIHVFDVTRELITTLSTLFSLQTLSITSSEPSWGSTTAPGINSLESAASISSMQILYHALREIQLPPHIHTLTLFTQLEDDNLDVSTQEQEANRFCEIVASVRPILQRIEIRYGNYWTGTFSIRWQRSAILTDDNVLGTLVFSEHKRTIIFPPIHHETLDTESRARRVLHWARQLFKRYF